MEPTDITVEILKSIRDEVMQTNSRLDQTNSWLDQTNSWLDQANSRLEEMREELGTECVHPFELASTVREMTSVVRVSLELGPRVERCEDDIRDLQSRLDRGTPR